MGQLRTIENGATIDVTADLNGVKLDGAQGLGKFIRDDPRVCDCLVRNVYTYGIGRKTDAKDENYLAGQIKAFANSGYRLPDLMAQIASSPQFFKVEIPGGVQRAPSPRAPAW